MKLDKLSRYDLNLLINLQVLLEEQSVSKAAKRLHVTQSAMSKTLARLRDLFEDPLFIRSAHGLRPTPRAESLHTQLASALQDIQQLIQPPKFDPATTQRDFTIVTVDSAYQLFLPSFFAPLLKAAPNMVLTFEDWSEESLQSIAQGRIDLGITARENAIDSRHQLDPIPPGVKFQHLLEDHEDHFVCLVRKDHPILSKPSWQIADYLSLSHVQASCEGHDRWALDITLAKQNKSRRIVVQVPEFHAALEITRNSDLIFTCPHIFARHAVQNYPLAMLPLPITIDTITYLMTWHQRYESDPGHKWLRETLYQHIRDNQASTFNFNH
ncbi:LysR family transcriptional regulator [Zooshikella harenae]|uniref:LysR family transcriptional regulator n=1 Tax=Zooshikella harenae TaxID=2827238 RepID=A0ABS5ZB80_9GAMM|nr:LysR family transcriptional regulator [Zooshikella harenae]MBU2711322.1 LysR family transcriptional regulator [Zooshikella harenae]